MCKFNEILGNKAVPLFIYSDKITDKWFVFVNIIDTVLQWKTASCG